jgi:WD40 repeat protein
MTIADYLATGGIHHAVAETAEVAFAGLTPPQQELARGLFRRLVTVTDDSADTRRRVPLQELGEEMRQVLDRFVVHRLLLVQQDSAEITHEALLTAWPRLRDWRAEDRVGLSVHRQLTYAASEWFASGMDASMLYRGGRLATAREWVQQQVASGRRELNSFEEQFLTASTELDAAERHAERRRTRRLRQLVASLLVLLIVTVSTTALSWKLRGQAAHERDLALSRQVAAAADRVRPVDVALATQLSLIAYRIAPTPEATGALLDSSAGTSPTRLLGPPGVMQALAASPDQRLLAGAGVAGAIRLWSLADPHRPRLLADMDAGSRATVFALAFSPDGHTLAAAGSDRVVRQWNLARPQRPAQVGQPLTGARDTIYSLAFSTDGGTLFAGDATGAIQRWQLTGSAGTLAHDLPALTNGQGAIQALAFDPTQTILAAGSADNLVTLWDVHEPTTPKRVGSPLTGASKAVFSVAFSADGRTLAAGSRDGKVYGWDVTRPATPVPWNAALNGPTSWVNAIAFTPDGYTLYAGTSDSQVWSWDLHSHEGHPMFPHPGPVTALRILTGTALVATADADGTLRLWPMAGRRRVQLPGTANQLTYRSDGAALSIGTGDNHVHLWDARDPDLDLSWVRQGWPFGRRARFLIMGSVQ